MDAADALATRPGEESKQLGEDAAFVFRYRKALDAEPLAASVLAALKTMAAEFGLDLDELKFIIEMREHALRATLRCGARVRPRCWRTARRASPRLSTRLYAKWSATARRPTLEAARRPRRSPRA